MNPQKTQVFDAINILINKRKQKTYFNFNLIKSSMSL